MADPPGTRGFDDHRGDDRQAPIKARTRKETENRIETLLKRVKQHFSSQRPSEQQSAEHVLQRPPDPAATALGRELAHAFVQTFEYPTSDTDFAPFRQRILDSLVHKGIHPSVPYAFFVELALNQSLLQQVHDAPLWQDWLPPFILQVEQEILANPVRDLDEFSGLHETLAASLKAYATFSAFEANTLPNPSSRYTGSPPSSHQEYSHIMTTYRRLEGAPARTQLLREFARSFPELQGVRQHLSPLMAACVLALWSTPHSEKTLFLDELFRTVWNHIYATEDFTQFWDVFHWMTDALNILLLVLPAAGRMVREQLPASLELCQRWLMELGDLVAFAVNATDSEDDEKRVSRKLHQWLNVVLNKTLPSLATQCDGYYRLSVEPLLEMLNGLIIELDMPQVDTSVVFRLATIAVVTPIKRETRSILALFSYLLPSSSPGSRGITSALGAVFISEAECSAAASFLLKTKQGIAKRLLPMVDRPIRNVVGMLDDVQKYVEVLTFVAKSDTYALENLSAVKQVEALLLAIAFRENQILQTSAYGFLQNLIRRYPHLGLLILPGLIEDLNLLSFEQVTDSVLPQLEFLCDTCFYNPNCAQKTWKMIVSLLESDNPLVIRVTILRLLPRIVRTNKSMYRRVISALGEHRNGKPSSFSAGSLQPDSMHVQLPVMEMKLAVVASICELAENDLILDVAEVTGWIQDFLCSDYTTDSMSALVVHYALLAIHHLVVKSGELDFTLVFKVLKKKLVDLTKFEDVKELPLVILESLALYLGDGECRADTSSESDDGPEEVIVSPQVCASVQLLIHLGSHLDGLTQNLGSEGGLLLKVRRNVISSLSRYSPETMGLDAVGVQSALSWYEEGSETQLSSPPKEASTYVSLSKIACGELFNLKDGLIEDEVITFVKKMLKFEEDTLSASLWKTRGTKHAVLQHKLDFALLPSPQEGTLLFEVLTLVQQIYGDGQPEFLVRLIRCLECLSLPGHFAKLFVEPLMSEDDATSKTGCVALLLSQISGRRRAAFEGSEWANLAMKIAISPMVSFQSLLGNGGGALLFVKSLKTVIYCLPPAFPIDNVVDNLWDITLALSQNDRLIVIEFLKQFRTILQEPRSGEKQGILSPKTMNYMQKFLVKKVFANLRELFWGDGNSSRDGSLLESFVLCLSELPLTALEQNDFFRPSDADGFAGEVARLTGILELSRRGYFSEPTSSIMRALSWMSRQLIAPGAELYAPNLRRMASAVAAASTVLSAANQRDILLSVLEQLLLCQTSAGSIGLDLLSVLVWAWSSDAATDGNLSLMYMCSKTTEKLLGLTDPALDQVFVFLRDDLPHNLAAFGRNEKISAVISNEIWRLINTWSKHGAADSILGCLRKTFICCCNGETKEDDFCTLTSSILFESDSTSTGL